MKLYVGFCHIGFKIKSIISRKTKSDKKGLKNIKKIQIRLRELNIYLEDNRIL